MNKLTHLILTRTVLIIAVGLLALTTPFAQTAVSAPTAGGDREDFVQIYEQDVFVIVGVTLRHPTADTPPETQLFNNAGVSLDLTWGQWQNASATSTASVKGGQKNPETDVRLHLTGLVPGGLYSVFYGTIFPDSENPLCPNVERTLALTAFQLKRQNPDPSSFRADANGEADYRGVAPGNLFSALQVFLTIIYHAYGETYHPLPNAGEYLTQGENCRSSFGEDSMRQLIVYQKFGS